MIGIKMSASLLALVTAVPLAAQPSPAPPAAGTNAEEAALRALEEAIYQDSLETYFMARQRANLPIDRFDNYSVQSVRDAEVKRGQHAAMLAKINPDRLTDVDRTTYRILQFELAEGALAEARYWLTFDLTSYLAPYAFLAAQQVLAAHPLATPDDARHYMQLLNAYAAMLESLTAKVEAQAARGIYLPRPALPVVRSTWQGIAATTGALKPTTLRIAALTPDARVNLLEGVDEVTAERLDSGFAKLAAVIGEAYANKATEAVGIGQYPGGKNVYRALIRTYTTLPLTPEDLQQRGLAAVAEIQTRMKAIRLQLGFSGTAREFYERISTDPRFIAKTPADVEATYWRYIHAIEPTIPNYFRMLPKAPYGVKRLPEVAEAGQTFGYYAVPTKAAPRGLYNYNASNLPNRSLINAGTLIYHELIPGHHFHMATQDENPGLSPFRKRYTVGAFTEGGENMPRAWQSR